MHAFMTEMIGSDWIGLSEILGWVKGAGGLLVMVMVIALVMVITD